MIRDVLVMFVALAVALITLCIVGFTFTAIAHFFSWGMAFAVTTLFLVVSVLLISRIKGL